VADIILHHYEMSPFSKKVISIFAHKNIAWEAVDQPVMAPKPDLTPLTGGYRKIPVMQIGAHIYCDTKLIIRELEKRFPETPLTPSALLGAAELIADWADHRLFANAAGPSIFEISALVPDDFLSDRAAMQRPEVMAAALPIEHVKAQFVLGLQMINRQLTGSSAFMLGDRFTLADAAVFHVLNFARNAPSLAAELAKHEAIETWLARIIDMGQGQRSDMAASDALAIARDATPDFTPPASAIEDAALPVGQMIAIRPDDYGQEVTQGEIVWTTAEALAVKRTDAQVGEVLVHYPRLGYLFEAGD
jgi:glutathione S-transferase